MHRAIINNVGRSALWAISTEVHLRSTEKKSRGQHSYVETVKRTLIYLTNL